MHNPFVFTFALVFVIVCFFIRWRSWLLDTDLTGKRRLHRPKGNANFLRPSRSKTYITSFLLSIFFLLFGTDISWLALPGLPHYGHYGVIGGLLVNFELLIHLDKTAIIFGAFLVSYLISYCISFVFDFAVKRLKN